jgi:hypothetical protein
MLCASCASSNQAEFPAEINIHFAGLKNIDRPGIFVFPKVVVCLDCGLSHFTIAETELALLVKGEVESEDPVTAPVAGNKTFAKWLREWTSEIQESPVLVEQVPLKEKAGADRQKNLTIQIPCDLRKTLAGKG